jgi:hypothetical protein
VRLSDGEQGGTAAHPQLSTINTAMPEPYLTQDSRIVCPLLILQHRPERVERVAGGSLVCAEPAALAMMSSGVNQAVRH